MINESAYFHQTAIGSNIAQAAYGGIATVNVYQYVPPQPVDAAILAAAHKRLAALPLDTIPRVATLPEGSRMPHPLTSHFVGRETELKELARMLKGGQTAAIGQIAAATGLGGIGKSQLAVAFAHHYGQYFAGGVYWLSFANPAAVPSEVVQCGLRMNLRPDFGQLKLDEQVPDVLSAWQSDLPRLLIFDNCEDEELLTRWRPPTGQSRLLITSRRQSWSATMGVQSLSLPTLPRPKSIELLLKFCPDLAKNETLNAIAETVGDLPLALHLAGSYLARYANEVTPIQYLADLKAINPLEHPSLQGRGAEVSPTQHELHAARTFALSYNRLQPDDLIDDLALKLLARAAYFAPGQPIPRELLLATLEPDAGVQENQRSLDLADALRRLTDMGLLERPTIERLSLHRLLAAFVKAAQPNSQAQYAVEYTLYEKISRINKSGDFRPALSWQNHLVHVTQQALLREGNQAALLANETALLLYRQGNYADARPLYESALTINERILGPNHPEVAFNSGNLAGLLNDQGDYVRAKSLYERALAITEKTLGPEHPHTATSLNNLAVFLLEQGDFEEAKSLNERALTIREKILRPDHPDTAASLSNLALALTNLGDYTGAKPLNERALAIREKVLGPDHPDTATSQNNLAELLRIQGDYGAARPLAERALTVRKRVLGSEHHDTAVSLQTLGSLLMVQGEYGKAKNLLEQALNIYEVVLGPKHPSVANVLDSLAALFRKQEIPKLAQPLLERALEIREKVLGSEHPATATSLNNLASLLESQGEYDKALPLYQRCLEISERTLGSKHPDTAVSQYNLGALYYTLGNLGVARKLFENVLEVFEPTLGLEHPSTRFVLNNLGAVCFYQNDFASAHKYMKKLLTVQEKMFGPHHPDTQTSYQWLRLITQRL